MAVFTFIGVYRLSMATGRAGDRSTAFMFLALCLSIYFSRVEDLARLTPAVILLANRHGAHAAICHSALVLLGGILRLC